MAIEVAVEAARLAAMDDLALSRDEARRAEIEEAEAAEAKKIAGGHGVPSQTQRAHSTLTMLAARTTEAKAREEARDKALAESDAESAGSDMYAAVDSDEEAAAQARVARDEERKAAEAADWDKDSVRLTAGGGASLGSARDVAVLGGVDDEVEAMGDGGAKPDGGMRDAERPGEAGVINRRRSLVGAVEGMELALQRAQEEAKKSHAGKRDMCKCVSTRLTTLPLAQHDEPVLRASSLRQAWLSTWMSSTPWSMPRRPKRKPPMPRRNSRHATHALPSRHSVWHLASRYDVCVRTKATGLCNTHCCTPSLLQPPGSRFQPLDPDWQFLCRAGRRIDGQALMVLSVWQDLTRLNNLFVDAYDPVSSITYCMPVNLKLFDQLLRRVSPKVASMYA